MKAKFIRYSMCICGYPLLKDEIPIGTIYEINEEVTAPFHWRCGGCHKINSVPGVWVYPREDQPENTAGFLPKDIFEPMAEGETTNQEQNHEKKKSKTTGE